MSAFFQKNGGADDGLLRFVFGKWCPLKTCYLQGGYRLPTVLSSSAQSDYEA